MNIYKKIIINGKIYFLDQNNKVNEGDVYFDEHNIRITIATSCSDHNAYLYKKVYASSDVNLTKDHKSIKLIPLYTAEELKEQEEDFYQYLNEILTPLK